MAAEETEVKRDLEQSDRDEVRVMTVHGAKASKRRSWLWPTRSPHPATAHRAARPFAGRKTVFRFGRPDDHSNVASQKYARESAARIEQEEYHRLLYVAMTRAEDRLYITGAQRRAAPSPDCWYNLIQEGMTRFAAPEAFDFTALTSDGWAGDGYVYSTESAMIADLLKARHRTPDAPESIPPWIFEPAPDEPTPPRPLTATRPSAAAPTRARP